MEDSRVTLNVGGHVYTTLKSTLLRHRNSTITRMVTGEIPSIKDEQGHIVIDGDGNIFRHVLNFLRTSELLLPDGFKELDLLAKEARVFQIHELTKTVASRRQNQEIRLEIREYKQTKQRSNSTKHLGVFTDWTVYGSYGVLVVINRIFHPVVVYPQHRSTPNINWSNQTKFVDPKSKMLHIPWYVTPLKYVDFDLVQISDLSRSPQSTGKTEEVIDKLSSLGFRVHSISDSVSTTHAIPKEFKHVSLHSAKTFTLREV